MQSVMIFHRGKPLELVQLWYEQNRSKQNTYFCSEAAKMFQSVAYKIHKNTMAQSRLQYNRHLSKECLFVVCVCISRHGLITARRQSITIRATNIKIGKKVPQKCVKDDTNFEGPAARAKKFHYKRCFHSWLLCGHYGSVWLDFQVVNNLSLVWATFLLIKHVSGAPQHLEILI